MCVCVCVCVWLCHDFFIHSSIYGPLGYFHVLPIVNNVAMNTAEQCFHVLWLNTWKWNCWIISSVQFSRSVMSDSLWPHESQYTRPPCPSPTPGVHSDSCSSGRWCHPVISSSVAPSPPAPNPSQHQSLFQWVNSLHEVAKVLEFQL